MTLQANPILKGLYTYSVVAPILAAVETSPAAQPAALDEDSESKHPQLVDEKRSTFSRGTASKPFLPTDLTSEKCLEQHLAHWHRYRGLSMAITARVVKTGLVYLAPLAPCQDDTVFQWFLYNAAIETSLSILQVALVHVVISQPSRRRFYQHIPTLSSWVTIAPTAVLCGILASANFYLPVFLVRVFGKADGSSPITNEMGLYTMGTVLFASATLFFLGLAPARAIFIRQAASILPKDTQLIVPFDRTFGGRVVPRGRLSMMDAWGSFAFGDRVRYFVIVGKAFGLMMAGWVLLFLLSMSWARSVGPLVDINYLA
ncbi:hypothetical protein BO78DRAFT_445888 [Aspergillus sclerotiicarbonarius CBS 121057]|uniref:Uncharacterized protein n=1 Tax=Aspergillus sclerotiicarbonarius (strain CBS 121057 / IBT 28362) TaxID=1448318 RepID=A0A319FGS3_ASPSB|nr:hypothetical protein BO78DRAFT_445888 [Aspergillus sclerotiicarbonarius CBS 121057]